MATYAEKLKDPRWQKKRLEIMNRDNWCCQKCRSSDITLAVHHKKYIYGNSPWDYPSELLVTLCDKCHKKEHSIEQVTAKEDAKTDTDSWIIKAMIVKDVYYPHVVALLKIRKEISERKKPAING